MQVQMSQCFMKTGKMIHCFDQETWAKILMLHEQSQPGTPKHTTVSLAWRVFFLISSHCFSPSLPYHFPDSYPLPVSLQLSEIFERPSMDPPSYFMGQKIIFITRTHTTWNLLAPSVALWFIISTPLMWNPFNSISCTVEGWADRRIEKRLSQLIYFLLNFLPNPVFKSEHTFDMKRNCLKKQIIFTHIMTNTKVTILSS